jgi:ferredoxin
MGFRSRLRNKISDVLKKKEERTGGSVTSSNPSPPMAHTQTEVSLPTKVAPSPLNVYYSKNSNGLTAENVKAKPHPSSVPDLKAIDNKVAPIETEQAQAEAEAEAEAEATPTLASPDSTETKRFTVHTIETDEYVSTYMSSDAPIRLAHHAETAEETTIEYQIKIKNPNGSLLQFRGARNEFVLDAADRAGLELPYSCRSGGCLSCAAKIISGVVHQSEQYVLEQEHLDEGYVLLCCCHASSDVEFIGNQEDYID